MILKVVGVFLFWRRNNLPSIVFKCTVWFALAWLLVGMFTSFQTAIIAGSAAAIVAGLRYSLKAHKTNKKLLRMVGGDKEKLGALKKKVNTKGLGGALMNEMLLAEVDDDEDDAQEYAEVELTDEQKKTNLLESAKLIRVMKDLCVQGKYQPADYCEEAAKELTENFEDGLSVPDTEELVSAFLPDNVLNIYCEDYCNEDDHAGLMEEFADATNGRWNPGECHSVIDPDTEQVTLTHQLEGKTKTWKFKQSGDWLNEKFMDALIRYTEKCSGHIITIVNTEDMVDLVCLPPEIHDAIVGDTSSGKASQAA